MVRVAVLVSGLGSNLQAILDAAKRGELPGAEIALVVADRREAFGIQRAIQAGVPVVYFPAAPYTRTGRPRSDYDADLAGIVRSFGVDWVVLAGWMRVLTNAFIRSFPGRILNLHPALPGTFPGTHAIERALAAYKRGEIEQTGIMVHLVPDEQVDAGPVIAQQAVPIAPDDTVETLEARVHAAEHRLLVQALADCLRGGCERGR